MDVDEYKRKFNRRTLVKNLDDKYLIGLFEMSIELTYIFFWISFLSVLVAVVSCLTVLRDEEEVILHDFKDSQQWSYNESSIV